MTENHDARTFTRASWVLLAGCVLVACAAEGTARFVLDRVSKIQRRTVDEYALAQTIGADACGRKHVLLIGNSLLEEDVRFDRVRAALADDWDARRFVIEQTFYYDWYYGLKRLFHEGARPDVVVVMLSSRQWIRSEIRGDYSAQYLMDTPDLLDAARDLNLNATQTTNLVVANTSKFWGARAEIRNFLLGRMMPDLGGLMNSSSAVDPFDVTAAEVEAIAAERIARLNELTDSYGARLVVLLPVLLDKKNNNAWLGMLNAAERQRVAALMPAPSGSFPLHLYRDAGFHLNPTGAAQFTDMLIPELQKTLNSVLATLARNVG
jgi:hypothetical protein